MSLKYKITILHIILSFVTALFIYMIYDSYVKRQEHDISKRLESLLQLNQNYMSQSLSEIQQLLVSKKNLSLETHEAAHRILDENPKYSLDKLKKHLTKRLDLNASGLDIEIFLVNSSYRVFASSDSKNRDLELDKDRKFQKAIKAFEGGIDIFYSKDVAVDFLEYKIKNYTYSKLSSGEYLGIGYMHNETLKFKENFQEMRSIAKTHMDMLCVMRDATGVEYYESLIEHKQKQVTTQQYLHNKKEQWSRKSVKELFEAAREWKQQRFKEGAYLHIFVPLIKEQNPIMEVPGDIILEVILDLSYEREFKQSILFKLLFFILMHFGLLFLIYYFTIRYQKTESARLKQIAKNSELIEYNKQFVSNMVHQIRTPLAVILSNVSLLEVVSEENIGECVSEIESSINLLSNSYENLSYTISKDSIQYRKREIALSEFLEERAQFFISMADAENKRIVVNIERGCRIYFNDLELERVIDNALANMLLFASEHESVLLFLYKEESKIRLITKSEIDVDETFFTKSKETYIKDSSSLGVGVYLIQSICEANGMSYSLKRVQNRLIMEFEW